MSLRLDRIPCWLLVYAMLLPLRQLEFLPVLENLGHVFHLTEVVFLVCAPALLWQARRNLVPRLDIFVLGTATLVFALTVSTFQAHHPQGYFELAGRYYLLGVFICFYWATRQFGTTFLKAVFRYWRYGAIALVCLAYLGFPLAYLGWDGLVWRYEDYPYFGTVYRASAAAGGATALLFLTWLPWLDDYARWRKSGSCPWFFLVCLPLYVLTLSKEVLIALILLIAMERIFSRARLWHYIVVAGLLAVYSFSTHFLIQKPQDIEGTVFTTAEYSPGKIAYRSDRVQLLETTYLSLKRVAVWESSQRPVFGIGADQFQQTLQDDRPTQIYPEHLPPYGPHSTWFGTLVEAGYLGLAGLILMVAGITHKIRSNLTFGPESARHYNACLSIFWVGLAAASFNCDYLHLQYVWVPIGIVMGQVGPKWEQDGL